MADNLAVNNSIYADYLSDFEQVADFYEYVPDKLKAYEKRSNYLRENYGQDRDELVDILYKYNQHLEAGQEVIENIELLRKKETTAVVTGQQAGIFTGPLYTVYKAITAILLAEEKKKLLDDPVVPIFWVASEDHDFQEINHLTLVNTSNELDRIELAGDYIATSIGDIDPQERLFDLIDALREKTYDTEFKSEIMVELKEAADKATDLADWFSRVLLSLFGDYGLIIFDPMWQEVRQLSGKLYQQFITKQSKLQQRFEETNSKLQNQGYPLQIEKEETNSHLFVYQDGKRHSLLKIDSEFRTRNSQLAAGESGILEMIEQKPTCFSPNVVLRPVLQNWLLPVIAYVGGPGEIAYHAQLKEIYSLFGLEMPILYPRQSITIVETRLAEYMEKYGLTEEDIVQQRLTERLEEELEARDELDISGVFRGVKEEFREEYRNLIDKISKIDKNLEELGKNNLERIIGQVEYLEDKTKQFHQKNNKILLRQFKKLRNNLLPQDKLQERVFNIMPYLIKYGTGFIDELVDYFDLSFEHRFYYLGGEENDS